KSKTHKALECVFFGVFFFCVFALVCLTLIYLLEVYLQFPPENERTPHTKRKDKNQEPHFMQ
ncbi:MAG: hypothetical protein O7C62_09060, partial [Rickettsia endosymbiont of Ixodes persulcatus]|nr:hypothetical protein [Rickettsia endosymbiont of Ixodes persulcatus]